MDRCRTVWNAAAPLVSGALAVCVLAIDLVLPLGVANGVLYVAPVLVALSSTWPTGPIVAATACSALTLAGALFSPTLAEVPQWVALTNRALSLVIIWMPVLFFTQRRRAQRALEGAYQELELRVQERTRALTRANTAMEAQIVERQKAEEALRESQARFAGILELAEDAVISIDQDERIILFNQAGVKTFGYAPDEVLGQPLDILLPPDVAHRHHAHITGFAANPEPSRRTGTRGEVFGRRKDGSLFPAEASISKLTLAGRTTFTVMLRDITERKRAEQDLRSLAVQLLTAQDEERRRISRDLHDDINQRLAILAVEAATLEQHLAKEPDRVPRSIRDIQQRVGELSDDVRRLAYQFHPSILDDLGLATALQRYVEDFSARTGIQVTFEWRDAPESLPREIGSCLYRVAQESLGNVAKHAGASRADVQVAGADGHITLTVTDTGAGIPEGGKGPSGDGLGLLSMKERVSLVHGAFMVESRAGKGTRICARIPLPGGEHHDQTPCSAGG